MTPDHIRGLSQQPHALPEIYQGAGNLTGQELMLYFAFQHPTELSQENIGARIIAAEVGQFMNQIGHRMQDLEEAQAEDRQAWAYKEADMHGAQENSSGQQARTAAQVPQVMRAPPVGAKSSMYFAPSVVTGLTGHVPIFEGTKDRGDWVQWKIDYESRASLMGMTAPEQFYRTAVLRLHREISRQWNTYAIDHSEIANWAGLNAYMSVHYGPLNRSRRQGLNLRIPAWCTQQQVPISNMPESS